MRSGECTALPSSMHPLLAACILVSTHTVHACVCLPSSALSSSQVAQEIGGERGKAWDGGGDGGGRS